VATLLWIAAPERRPLRRVDLCAFDGGVAFEREGDESDPRRRGRPILEALAEALGGGAVEDAEFGYRARLGDASLHLRFVGETWGLWVLRLEAGPDPEQVVRIDAALRELPSIEGVRWGRSKDLDRGAPVLRPR
jgi:hypothetical protein